MLAVTSRERLKELPDVPTMTELGYPSVFLDIWFGLVAPRGTPPELVSAIHDRVDTILHRPDIVNRLAELGLYVRTNTPDQFRAMIKDDIARLGVVVSKAQVRQ